MTSVDRLSAILSLNFFNPDQTTHGAERCSTEAIIKVDKQTNVMHSALASAKVSLAPSSHHCMRSQNSGVHHAQILTTNPLRQCFMDLMHLMQARHTHGSVPFNHSPAPCAKTQLRRASSTHPAASDPCQRRSTSVMHSGWRAPPAFLQLPHPAQPHITSAAACPLPAPPCTLAPRLSASYHTSPLHTHPR